MDTSSNDQLLILKGMFCVKIIAVKKVFSRISIMWLGGLHLII